MNTFVIRRRSAWGSAQELEQAAERSTRVGNDEMPDQVRWIRSYAVTEPDGRLGTVCVYQAVDEEAIREHARRARMPADEIVPVTRTVLVRDDPGEDGVAS
jgi:hypothetical protein